MRAPRRTVIPSVGETLDLLRSFDPGDDDRVRSSVRMTTELLLRARAPFSRSHFDPGHVTASAVVLSPHDPSLLLVRHERLARWLQPGGHVEAGDRQVIATARREVQEETGLALDEAAPGVLVAVDVHEIPADRGEPCHLHHDFMFCFVVPAGAPSYDGPDWVWCPVARLADYDVDRPLQRAIERALSTHQW